MVRPGCERKFPPGTEIVIGAALVAESVRPHLAGIDTVVPLAGVAKPGPAEARQFREIDLVQFGQLWMRSRNACKSRISFT